jgi:hypothetical protein
MGELSSTLIYLVFDLAFAMILWNWSNENETPSFNIPFKLLSALAFIAALMQVIAICKIIFL